MCQKTTAPAHFWRFLPLRYQMFLLYSYVVSNSSSSSSPATRNSKVISPFENMAPLLSLGLQARHSYWQLFLAVFYSLKETANCPWGAFMLVVQSASSSSPCDSVSSVSIFFSNCTFFITLFDNKWHFSQNNVSFAARHPQSIDYLGSGTHLHQSIWAKNDHWKTLKVGEGLQCRSCRFILFTYLLHKKIKANTCLFLYIQVEWR